MRLVHPTSFQRLLCNVSGHKFRLTKKITNNIKHYQCINCGYEVSTNFKGQLVPLTEELKNAHSGIQNIIVKRNYRKHQKQTKA